MTFWGPEICYAGPSQPAREITPFIWNERSYDYLWTGTTKSTPF